MPIPLYRDTDDDLLQEPRERRVRHEPRPALRDPMASPAYRARFERKTADEANVSPETARRQAAFYLKAIA